MWIKCLVVSQPTSRRPPSSLKIICDGCAINFLISHGMTHLKEAVHNSNHDITSVKSLTAVYDYKAWLSPYINTPHNHTAPHNFLFRCDERGKAIMLYRNWSSNQWLPSPPNHGLELLKQTPPERPGKIRPSFDKLDMEKLKKDIRKYENAGVPPEKMAFWNNIDDVFSRLEGEAVSRDELHPLDVMLSKKHFSTAEEVLADNIPEKVTDAVQKDQALLSEVYTGPARKRSRTDKESSASLTLPPSTEQPTTPTLKNNQLVAVLTETLEDAPWLGQVKEVKEDSIGIVWMEGSYSGKWKKAKVRKGRKMVDWEDRINTSSIVLSGFGLDKSNKLAIDTVTLLKESYNSYF